MAKANVTTVYRTEYYDNRLYSWVAFHEGTNLERARACLSTPVIGDPRKRVAEYQKSGVRKVKYSFVGVIE